MRFIFCLLLLTYNHHHIKLVSSVETVANEILDSANILDFPVLSKKPRVNPRLFDNDDRKVSYMMYHPFFVK